MRRRQCVVGIQPCDLPALPAYDDANLHSSDRVAMRESLMRHPVVGATVELPRAIYPQMLSYSSIAASATEAGWRHMRGAVAHSTYNVHTRLALRHLASFAGAPTLAAGKRDALPDRAREEGGTLSPSGHPLTPLTPWMPSMAIGFVTRNAPHVTARWSGVGLLFGLRRRSTSSRPDDPGLPIPCSNPTPLSTGSPKAAAGCHRQD